MNRRYRLSWAWWWVSFVLSQVVLSWVLSYTFAGTPQLPSSSKTPETNEGKSKSTPKKADEKIPPAKKDTAQKPPAEKVRRFSDGPLTAADFKMEVPNPVPSDAGIPFAALTYAELQYRYTYQWKESGGTITTYPIEVTLFSIVDQNRSWNDRPQDLRILDHEQGHFDIAEIEARKDQEKMKKMVADKTFLGKGKTETEAKKDLESQMNKEFQKLVDALMVVQREYDRVTYHGTNLQAQAETRKVHQAALFVPTVPKP